MCFNQANTGRRKTCIFVSTLQRFRLSFWARSVNAFKSTITGGANTFDHSINSVIISLSILQTFEYQDSDAFTQHHPIRLSIERLNSLVWGEGRGFAETHIDRKGVIGVNSSSEHHVSAMLTQLTNCHF